MNAERYISTFKGVLLGCLLAFFAQIFFYSPISPDSLQLPPPTLRSFPWNNDIQRVTRLGEGFLDRPESVCVDKQGTFYTATRDGWIKRLDKSGSWQNWKMIGGDALLGITASVKGGLLVCDADKGLLKVDDDGITILTSQVNGSKIRFADDASETQDGIVYFSDASTKFGLHDWYLDVLEAKPHGRLLKYDPSTKETSIVLDDLCFPNGVALSADQNFVVVCETWKFRCLRYWLKGELKGTSDVFIDNLPGGPDNINLAPDGSFWIALLELRLEGIEFVHRSKVAKHFIAAFPKLVQLIKTLYKKAMIVNVGVDGKIVRKFDDSEGKVMSFVTSAFEFEDHIYLGSLNSEFVGKLRLNKA
ncbi:hypothetical protein GIB67_025963 [Kingdonia uniflora]|uniref:Strictosidine synthase conserved region domain-containing protein n=1 Tax=Kingdonia uniflora TaxID=39325 RepID=A0A7J7L843_9MAGN|nr:hypothetical protein GIB67_025963 [Kingdonia uniflora]